MSVENILKSCNFSSVVKINDVKIEYELAKKIAVSIKKNKSIKGFELNNVAIKETELGIILNALSKSKSLEKIKFFKTKLDRISGLVRLFNNSDAKIKSIIFDNVGIKYENIETFVDGISNSIEKYLHLEEVNVKDNYLKDYSVKKLINGLEIIKNEKLKKSLPLFKSINLSGNGITLDSLRELKVLTDCAEYLDLSGNQLGVLKNESNLDLKDNKGNLDLKDLVLGKALRELNLSENQIYAESGISLAAGLKNSSLVSLDLSNNRILVSNSDNRLDKRKKNIKLNSRPWKNFIKENKSLRVLNLSENQIDNLKVNFIIESIKENKGLCKLDLSKNFVSGIVQDNLIAEIMKNKALISVKIECPEEKNLILKKYLEENKNSQINEIKKIIMVDKDSSKLSLKQIDFLTSCNQDLIKQVLKNKSLLLWAVENNQFQLVKLIMQKKPVIKPLEEFKLLYTGLKNGSLQICNELLSCGLNINVCNGSNNTTLLHEALKEKWSITAINFLLKNGADPKAKNANGYTPIMEAEHLKVYSIKEWAFVFFQGLECKILKGTDNKTFKENIMRKKNHIAKMNNIFQQKSAASILTDITLNKSGLLVRKGIEKGYNQMLNIPEVKPLLEIAAFAAHGLHDLSVINDNNKELTITIDPDQSDVKQATFEMVEKNAYGVYLAYENDITIAGKRFVKLPRGTLAHEITHLVANEIYKNNCNPYFPMDRASEDRFEDICEDLRRRKATLHERLESVFDSYDSRDWHKELIVRIPQLIIMTGGYEIVEKQCPELYAYYKEVFLEDCKKHLDFLKKKNYIVDNIKKEDFPLDKSDTDGKTYSSLTACSSTLFHHKTDVNFIRQRASKKLQLDNEAELITDTMQLNIMENRFEDLRKLQGEIKLNSKGELELDMLSKKIDERYAKTKNQVIRYGMTNI